ncbi:MAG TPA: hypothetical protein VN455_11065 [Methanotrichaceae archaeon]|nr:hypothetical protein [Methanotrichaceae archaeon]
MSKLLEDFFAEYAAMFNRSLGEVPDIDAITGVFASCFIAADPNGVACGKNDDQLRAAIAQGYQFYKSIGTKSMKIVSLEETPLDDCHSMVKVYYQALYRKSDGREETIDFDVIYLLQTIGERPKIFAYISGDERKVLRERGII